MKVDALVIGAGPAGSTVSYLLSKAGLDTLMVDRRSELGKKSCSGMLGQLGLKELLTKDESLIISKLKWAEFQSPGKQRIRIEGDIGCIVDRLRLDVELVELAASEGTKVLKPATFIGLRGERSAVISSKSRREVVGFEYLIGADGAGSSVSRCLKWSSPKPYAGIQLTVPRRDVPDEGFVMRLRRGSRFSWAHPYGGEGRAGALGEAGEPVMAWAQAMTHSGADGAQVGAMPKRLLKKFSKGNVALVGDAAGQVKPLSRGGILFGVVGAKELAKAVLESHEKGSASISSSYEKRWWERFGGEIRIGLAIRDSIDRAKPQEIDALFVKLRHIEHDLSERFNMDGQAGVALRSITDMKSVGILASNPLLTIRGLASIARWVIHYLMP